MLIGKGLFAKRTGETIDWLSRCAARSRAAIKEAKSLGEDRTGQPCMISAILEKEDSEGVEQFTERELRDEVLTFML